MNNFTQVLFADGRGFRIFAHPNFQMDTITDITQKYSDLIRSRILDDAGGYKLLTGILQCSKLEKDLLTTSKYDRVEFVPDTKRISALPDVHFEKLAMINPPSFEFSMMMSISGFFRVWYGSLQNPLPIRTEPFRVRYSGILIDHDQRCEIISETVKVVRNNSLWS